MSYQRKEVIGNCTLYLGDCLEILPTLVEVDAVVTDPPYGMRYKGHSGGGNSIHTGDTSKHRCATIKGDDADFDPSPWLQWPCVFTGATWFYERLPAGGSMHAWDKRGDYERCSFADADIVWCSHKVQSQVFRLVWRGICRHDEYTQRIEHPTQKPVALMQWMVQLVSKPGVVLDPYMGSGSTALAQQREGGAFIGIEIDEGYFDIACERIRAAYAQPDMFVEGA